MAPFLGPFPGSAMPSTNGFANDAHKALRRDANVPTDYPGAMECMAIPYGGVGFVSDLIAIYIFICMTYDRVPLLPWREISRPKSAQYLAVAQLLCCEGLLIYTLATCNGHAELVLVGVARILFVFIYLLSAAFSGPQKDAVEPSAGGGEPSTESPGKDSKLDDNNNESEIRDDQLEADIDAKDIDPRDEDAKSENTLFEETKDSDDDAREKVEEILDVADKPHNKEPPPGPPAPEEDTTKISTPGTTQPPKKRKRDGPWDIFILYAALAVPLALMIPGAYLVLKALDPAGGETETDARYVFVFLTVFLVLLFCLLISIILPPVCRKVKNEGVRSGLRSVKWLDIMKIVRDADGKELSPWGVLLLAGTGVTLMSNWALGVAAGSKGGIPISQSLDVTVRYWVYFGVSKLIILMY